MNEITKEQLSAYLDNALPSAEREAVDRALGNSPALKTELEILKRLRSLLKEIPAPEPSEDFYQRVLAKVEERRRPWLWIPPLVAAAAAAMVMVYIAHDTHRSLRFTPAFKGGESVVPPSIQLSETARETRDESAIKDSYHKFKFSTSSGDETTKSASGKAGYMAGRSMDSAATRQDWAAVRKEKLDPTALAVPREVGSASFETLPQDFMGEGQATTQVPHPPLRGTFSQAEKDTPRVFPLPLGEGQGEGVRPGQLQGQAKPLMEPAKKERFKEVVLAEAPERPLAVPAISPSPGTSVSANDGGRASVATGDWKGDDSAIADRRDVVVRSDKEWQALWKTLFANRIPAPPVPAVDFSRYMIVGIFQGSKPSSGYAVTIERVVAGEKNIQVLYKETTPDPAMAQLTVMTAPYYLKMVPQSSLPVIFKKVK